jgi:hypothetical protein
MYMERSSWSQDLLKQHTHSSCALRLYRSLSYESPLPSKHVGSTNIPPEMVLGGAVPPWGPSRCKSRTIALCLVSCGGRGSCPPGLVSYLPTKVSHASHTPPSRCRSGGLSPSGAAPPVVRTIALCLVPYSGCPPRGLPGLVVVHHRPRLGVLRVRLVIALGLTSVARPCRTGCSMGCR